MTHIAERGDKKKKARHKMISECRDWDSSLCAAFLGHFLDYTTGLTNFFEFSNKQDLSKTHMIQGIK